MKRLNKKLITFMLAGVCTATLGVAAIKAEVAADEETTTTTYSISNVFATDTSNSAVMSFETVSDKQVAYFEMANGQSVYMPNDLALKWYENKDTAKYLKLAFAFKTLDFESVTFEIESAASVATEEEKSYNAIKFTVDSEKKVSVVIVNGKAESAAIPTTITAGSEVTVELTAGSAFDSFGIKLNGATLSEEFTEIGADYAAYETGKTNSLKVNATTKNDDKAVVYLHEINGQRFDNLTTDGKLVDTAAPVLVINEDINTFEFGTQFSVAYEKIDVLQSSGLSETKRFYQFNPADTEAKHETFTTNPYFLELTYYYKDNNGTIEYSNEAKQGFTATSARAEEGKEYVSITFTLSDKFTQKKEYNLSWYATDVVSKSNVDYIVVDQNEEAPTYSYIVKDEANNKNVYSANGQVGDAISQQAAKEALYGKADGSTKGAADVYQELVEKAAQDVYAGSSSSINLPAIDWLIKDNGGYRSLKFTISYRKPSTTASGSPTGSSNLSYNGLKLTTTEVGKYEFKIFAVDKAGNTMQYYDNDGELVALDKDNVWDIDEIPSFEFTIKNKGIKVDELKDSEKVTKKTLDQTYTISGLKVAGVTNEESAYALYRFDDSQYVGPTITKAARLGVKFETIQTKAKSELSNVGDGKKYATYFDLYLELYAKEIAAAISGNANDIKACFKSVQKYNSAITEDDAEWEEYNKYQWNPTSKSFTAAEKGDYLILADFSEYELSTNRAMAYKYVEVGTNVVIEGESQFVAWVKNNVVSVVLFGIAGLMLIAIVILLFVKPSDETLEDVDAKAAKKKDTKKKDK